MARYSDIKRGAQLNTALTAYTTYLTTPRTPNINSRGARPAQTATGVVPFDLDLGADEVIQVNSPTAGVNGLATIINANSIAAVFSAGTLTGKTIVSNAGFKPARIVVQQAANRVVSVATSDITNTRYLKYDVDRLSCAFGRKGDAETGKMIQAFNGLKATLKARQGFEINRVSLVPEKYQYR